MSTVGGEGAYSKQANEGNVDDNSSDGEGCPQDVPPFVMPPRRATVALAAPIRTDSEASDITGTDEADEGDDRMHFGGRPGRRPSAPASRINTNDTTMMRRTTMPAGSLPTSRATGKNRTGSGGSGGNYPPTDYNDPQLATRTLMVYRFPREAQEVDLACRFGAFGPIEHVKVVYDPVTHLPRCYGFVRFCYRESCIMALKACEDGKIMMDDPFGRTWHFEAKWARNARAAGEIDRNGGEKEPQPPLPVASKTFTDASAEERGGSSLLPNPAGGGDSTNKSDETKTPTSTRAPASGATPGPADPFASFSDADLALINAATSPVISGIESRELIDEDNSVQALSAKALEEAENLATSSAAAAAAAAALSHSGTSQADLAKLIETVFKAVRSSALAHLTGGTLGQPGGTPQAQNATAMHDFLASMVDEPSVLPPPSDSEAVKRSSTNGSS
ncbi:hypothetical protein FOL47_007040 [Perkinsus chesapeaki]|uniref:RRM domain-containing protein n=1 Tax=Perkinsus chesapeaki TaxID=330153 RepID=A0A7J6LP91_PERCH|nr:hypothetical protein FOL47_007040 [Perkinsus chesapeaki]